jgi:hypothetical protein
MLGRTDQKAGADTVHASLEDRVAALEQKASSLKLAKNVNQFD